MVKWYKNWVHEWFHVRHDDSLGAIQQDDSLEQQQTEESVDEESPRERTESLGLRGLSETESLLVQPPTDEDKLQPPPRKQPLWSRLYSCSCAVIPVESHRAAVAGALAGFMCGWVAIFVPHTLFWGEAQLQNLIDKGRTPLPVFEDMTGDMVTLGYCLIDRMDPAAIGHGVPIGCSALLAVSKTIVIGLSLGTGIIGGHFWGPLFVGCAAGHFLSDLVNMAAIHFELGEPDHIFAYPCLAILCTMGAAHVVSFRAHTAIMLILTLTISTFSPQDENPYFGMAGDYAAIFPLLVISVFISMIMSQGMVFYTEQQNRGDILAVREVLQEPGVSVAALDEESRGGLTSNAGHPGSRLGDVRHEPQSISEYGSVCSVDAGGGLPSLGERDAMVKEGNVRRFDVSSRNHGLLTNQTMSVPSSPITKDASSRLDELLMRANSSDSSFHSSKVGSSQHRVVGSTGEIKFVPHLFEQARAHRETLSRRNSLAGDNSDIDDQGSHGYTGDLNIINNIHFIAPSSQGGDLSS